MTDCVGGLDLEFLDAGSVGGDSMALKCWLVMLVTAYVALAEFMACVL